MRNNIYNFPSAGGGQMQLGRHGKSKKKHGPHLHTE